MYKESATYTCKVQLSKPSRIGYWKFFFFFEWRPLVIGVTALKMT